MFLVNPSLNKLFSNKIKFLGYLLVLILSSIFLLSCQKSFEPFEEIKNYQILFLSNRGSYKLIKMDITGENQHILINDDYGVNYPYSINRFKVVYSSTVIGGYDIFIFDMNSQIKKRLTNHDNWNINPHLSKDALYVVYQSETHEVNNYGIDICIADIQGNNIRNLTNDKDREF